MGHGRNILWVSRAVKVAALDAPFLGSEANEERNEKCTAAGPRRSVGADCPSFPRSQTEGQLWSTAAGSVGRDSQEGQVSLKRALAFGERPLAAPRSGQQSCVVSRCAVARPHGPT